MNKMQLIDEVAKKAGISKKDAGAAIEAFTDTVEKVLKSGDRLQIVGFGSFESIKRAARKGKNPRTGEVIKIPAVSVPKFRAGSALKEAARKAKKK